MPNAINAGLRAEIEPLKHRLDEMSAKNQKASEIAAEAVGRLNLSEAMLEIIPVGVVLSVDKKQII